MDNLNNSHAAKENAQTPLSNQKSKAVANGHLKKDNESKSLINTFVKHDIKSIWSYLYSHVLDPNIRKLLYDMVTNTVHMILYDGTKKNQSYSSSRADQVSYRRYYDEPERSSRVERPKRTYQQVTFDTKEEAENVLVRMQEIIDAYDFVRVADYYDLSKIDDINYTDNGYGWDDLDEVDVIPDDDGSWIIDLPRPRPRR